MELLRLISSGANRLVIPTQNLRQSKKEESLAACNSSLV